MRVLIVDDEPLAREGVEIALRDVQDAEVIGTCADGVSALRSIRRLAPDLVFLDVKMPGLDGFEVIQHVGPEKMPAVIFLTAYEEHALRAFRVHAVDYLLKPIDAEALAESLDRARLQIAQAGILRRGEQLRGLLDGLGSARSRFDRDRRRIVVRAGGRVYLFEPEQITWVEAAGDYVTLHAAEETHLVRASMKNMQARLGAHGFRRIHRSALVNVACISQLIANDNGDYQVLLRDGTKLRLSRSYRDALYAALNVAL